MKQNKYTILFFQHQSIKLLVILQVIFFRYTILSKSINFVYEDQNIQSLTVADVSLTKIKQCQDFKYIIASGGYDGLFLISQKEEKLDIIGQITSKETFVKGFDITQDCRHIAMNYENRLTIFFFNSTNQQTYQIISANDSIPQNIVDLTFNNDQSLIYIVGSSGNLQVFQLQIQQGILKEVSLRFSPQSQSYLSALNTNFFAVRKNMIFITTTFAGIRIVYEQVISNAEFYLQLTDIGYYQEMQNSLLLTNDGQYIITLNQWNGISFGNLAPLKDWKINDKPQTFQFFKKGWWPSQTLNPSPLDGVISNDDKFLFIAARSQGLYIIDIQDIYNPQSFQHINSDGTSILILFSPKNKYLYFSNSKTIDIFTQEKDYLSNQFPNLFNSHLGTQELSDLEAKYKWRCYINSKNQYYFGAYDDRGLVLAKLLQQGTQTLNQVDISQFFTQKYFFIDSLLFNEDETIAFIPLVNSQEILGIFNISNVEKPQVISTIKSDIFSRLEQMAFNSDRTLIAATFGQSIIIMNITDIYNPMLVNRLSLNQVINSQCSGIMFTNNDRYLLISSRGQGFLVLSFNSIIDIQIVNFLSTLGGEDIQPFIGNSQYAFLIDGYNGVLIANLKSLPEIDIISRIQLPGWSNNILQFDESQYVIISTMDSGMISLFDISIISNPIFISSYQKSNQNAYSTCKTSSNSHLFINNQFGVQTLPLNSEFSIHTQFSEIQFSESQNLRLRKNQKHNILEVGQQIRLTLRFIYPQIGVIIKGISYYFNEEILDIPYWMSFSSTSYTIDINVSKDGLMEDKVGINLNTLIIKSQIPIQSSMFIIQNEEIQIDQTLSERIVQILLELDLIDSQNYLNEEFLKHGIIELLSKSQDYFNDYNFSEEQKQKTIQFIKQIIFKTIQYNPIYLYIKPSLFLNEEIKKGNIIETNSQYASIQISVEEKYGSFYVIDDSGVQITYSEAKSMIILAGDVKLVNQILNSLKVIFINSQSFNNTQLINQIPVSIEIQDNINYNVLKNCTLVEATFISLKKQIEIQQKLQDLFEQAYTGGQIKVDSYLYFQFAVTNFVDPQNFPLHFTAKYRTDSTPEEEVVGSGWLQFSYNQESLRIQGLVPQTLFWSDVYITIIASNGYQEIEETFSMNISIISFSLFLNFFFQVAGPVAGIIGFYKYRYIPYNILYKQRLFSSPEIIQVDQEYLKKFPLLNSDFRRAKKIFTQYKRYVIKELEKEFKEDRQKQKKDNTNEKNKMMQSQKYQMNSSQNQQNSIVYSQNSILQRKKSIEESTSPNRPKKQSIFSQYHYNQNIKESDEVKEADLPKKVQDNNSEFKSDGIVQFNCDQKSSLYQKFTMVKSVRLISDKEYMEENMEMKNHIQQAPNKDNERKISSGKREKTLSSDSSDEDENDIDQIIDECQQRRKIGKLTTSQVRNSLKTESNQRLINLIRKYQEREQNEKSLYRTDFQDYVIRKFLRKNGKLRMSQIIEDILSSDLKITYKRKYVSIRNYKDDLENEFSVLHVSLRSFFARFLLSKNKPTKIVYKFIKKTCQRNHVYTARDWYKAIVDIKATKQTDKNGINVPFPNLFIKEEEFKKFMNNLQIIRYRNNTYDMENNMKINLYLLKEVLFADTLGLHTTNIDSIQPTFGESIHFNSSQISSVEALIPIKHSSWLRIRQFLNLDNREYGCSKNNKLPNWVHFNQKSNVIIIHGIPLKHDVEDILIRVYDVDNFILVQYQLKIINNNINMDFNIQQSLTTSCIQHPQNQLASLVQNRRISITSSFKKSPTKSIDQNFSQARAQSQNSNDVIKENDNETNEYYHQTVQNIQNESLVSSSFCESQKQNQQEISIPHFSHMLGSQLGIKVSQVLPQQELVADKSF